MPTVFLQSVPECETGLCTDVEGRKWWIARCRDQWRGVAAEAQIRTVAIMSAALMWNGTMEREAEIEAAFRAGAEAAREDIESVVDNYPGLCSEFAEVADEFLSVDDLWSEYKKGGQG